VIDSFVKRIEETIGGTENGSAKQGLLDDFRGRLERGEVEVHHHHAEFKAEHSHDHEHSHQHEHSHGHDHSHGHSHAPYKHIAHPQGPRTMINDNVCCCFMGQFPQHVVDEEKELKAELPGTPSCKKN